jgi:hypothetical protein
VARRPDRRSGPRILLAPALLAAATAVGLGAGLLGDGAVDLLAWGALGLPVAAALAFGARR